MVKIVPPLVLRHDCGRRQECHEFRTNSGWRFGFACGPMARLGIDRAISYSGHRWRNWLGCIRGGAAANYHCNEGSNWHDVK